MWSQDQTDIKNEVRILRLNVTVEVEILSYLRLFTRRSRLCCAFMKVGAIFVCEEVAVSVAAHFDSSCSCESNIKATFTRHSLGKGNRPCRNEPLI